jgi:hypothetical protein
MLLEAGCGVCTDLLNNNCYLSLMFVVRGFEQLRDVCSGGRKGVADKRKFSCAAATRKMSVQLPSIGLNKRQLSPVRAGADALSEFWADLLVPIERDCS